jgi:hypothetical protein
MVKHKEPVRLGKANGTGHLAHQAGGIVSRHAVATPPQRECPAKAAATAVDECHVPPDSEAGSAKCLFVNDSPDDREFGKVVAGPNGGQFLAVRSQVHWAWAARRKVI